MPEANPYRNVDLDACVCVDLGHHWRHLAFADRASEPRWQLRGVAHRLMVCLTCSSGSSVALDHRGRPIEGTRNYDLDETYARESRKLGATLPERRANYRRELLRRSKALVSA